MNWGGGGVQLVPFYEAEHASTVASLKTTALTLGQFGDEEISKFLLNDGKEVGYGASAIISSSGEDGKSSRIYGIKRSGVFLAFQVTAVLNTSMMTLTLEIFEPVKRKWSIDVDIATGQVVGGESRDNAGFESGIEPLDWSGCVWKCLKKKAPNCVYCLSDPDCWTLCAGGTVAVCVWDCSW